MPPAKAAPSVGFFANKPPRGSPGDATTSPVTPRGVLSPRSRGAAREGGTYLLGPRCRPASLGWGGSSARHKREQAVSGGAVPPPRTPSTGKSRVWPQPGAGEGPARTEPGLVATLKRGCCGHRAMLRPRGRVPGAAGARWATGASLGRLPAFLDCKGLQRRRQHPAGPGPSGSTATALLFPVLTPFWPPLVRRHRGYLQG